MTQTPLMGKQIFIQGSPTLKKKKGIKIGRLSGIVAHHVPFYLKHHPECQVWEVNSIDRLGRKNQCNCR